MPKQWTEDTGLVSSMADNLLEAMTVFPKRLLRLDELSRQFDMPLSQLQLIVLLSREDMSISALAECTGIAKPNITPLVDAMSAKHLVERIHSTKDRRVVYLHLCDEGRACMEGIREAVRQQVIDWPVQYNRSEARELNSALVSIVRLAQN